MVLLILFLISCGLLLIYLLVFQLRLARHHPLQSKTSKPRPISVIICARNEAANLNKNLPILLNQDYPEWELIIVNDHSDDGTLELIRNYPSNGKIVPINLEKAETPGKKQALYQGVKEAKYDWIIVTDADCRPKGKDWLRYMSAYGDEIDLVLGISFVAQTKGLFNKWVLWDQVSVASEYLSFSLMGLTYMGVGRNMAYSKRFFNSGWEKSSKIGIASGDDDLLVRYAGNNFKTGVQIHPDAMVFTGSKRNLKEWIVQKSRHHKTGAYYRMSHLLLLGLWRIAALTYFIAFVTLCIMQSYIFLILLIFTIRLILHFIIFGKVLKRLHGNNLIYLVPFFEPLYALFQIIIIPLSLLRKGDKWQ